MYTIEIKCKCGARWSTKIAIKPDVLKQDIATCPECHPELALLSNPQPVGFGGKDRDND